MLRNILGEYITVLPYLFSRPYICYGDRTGDTECT